MVSDEITLNTYNLFKLPNSEEAVILMDEQFVFKKGMWSPFKLQLIGFLYCQFSDERTHLQDLWLLLNPKLNPSVPRSRIREVFQDLMYVAIDQRLSKYLFYI